MVCGFDRIMALRPRKDGSMRLRNPREDRYHRLARECLVNLCGYTAPSPSALGRDVNTVALFLKEAKKWKIRPSS